VHTEITLSKIIKINGCKENLKEGVLSLRKTKKPHRKWGIWALELWHHAKIIPF
jgi:hypothetical protein